MRRHRWEASLDNLDGFDCTRQSHIVVEAESLKGRCASARALNVECKAVIPGSNKRLHGLWLLQGHTPTPLHIPTSLR